MERNRPCGGITAEDNTMADKPDTGAMIGKDFWEKLAAESAAYCSADAAEQADPESAAALTVDMEQACLRGNVEKVICCDETAVLLKHRCGIYMLWARTADAGRKAIGMLGSDDPLYHGMRCCVTHGKAARDAVAAETKLYIEKPCIQFCRYSKEKLPLAGIGRVRELALSDLPVVLATYRKSTEEHLRKAIEKGEMFGIELDGELAAFVGMHQDGSVGMLEVLPKFRRRGIGTELESYMHNMHIDRGWVPYGQVYTDNAASLGMQAKFGLIKASEPVWWAYRTDIDF